jgi:hypothetical protein
MGQWMYRHTFSWPRHYLEVSGQLHGPAAFTPRERAPLYPLNRRLGGPQSRSGRDGEVKILNPILTVVPIDLLVMIFSLLSLFWKNKSRLMRSPCFLCVCISLRQLLNAWTNLYETWYVYHGTWAMSAAYFINPYHHSECVCVSPLGRNVTAATNTHATSEALLNASFSLRSVSYERKVKR